MCDPRPTAKSSLAASEIKTIDGKTRYRGENDHRREIETERRREQPPEEKWNRCSLFQPVKSSFVAYLAGADDDDVDRRGLITMIMTMTSRNDRLEWQSLRRRVNCASRNNACWISAPIIRHCVTHKTSAESDTCVSASWCSFLSLSLSPYRLSQNTCRTLLSVINVYMFAILRISIVLSVASCSDLSWTLQFAFSPLPWKAEESRICDTLYIFLTLWFSLTRNENFSKQFAAPATITRDFDMPPDGTRSPAIVLIDPSVDTFDAWNWRLPSQRSLGEEKDALILFNRNRSAIVSGCLS